MRPEWHFLNIFPQNNAISLKGLKQTRKTKLKKKTLQIHCEIIVSRICKE